MSYNFRDRDVADELKRIALHNLGNVTDPRLPTGNELIIVKAPVAGIAAIVGTTVTSGTCTRMFVSQGDPDVDLSEDTAIEIEVFNTTSEEIAGGSYFQAARVGTSWVSVAGGGGSDIKQIVASSLISAASGLTVGSGTGNLHELNAGGTAYVDSTTSVDVRNPWEETIAIGSMMTCHKEGDYYVVIQASCPSP